MKNVRMSRRELAAECIGKGLLVAGTPMTASTLLAYWEEGHKVALKPTAHEVLGPFYKKGAPEHLDMRIAGEKGFPLRIQGKVVNAHGEKISGAIVELWHADQEGRYDVTGYRYRSKINVKDAGEYAVETFMPGHYNDRPAQHVHYMITAPGHKPLITQLYFATDPYFESDLDKNWNKRGIVSNRDLIRPVALYEGPGAPRATTAFDIVMEKA